MEIVTALNRMEEIEMKAAELYKIYHAAFYHDKDAAYFFYKMHLEEKGHRNLVQYVKKLVRQNPKLFERLDCMHADFDKIARRLDKEIARKKPPALDEALDIAEEFEVTLCEGYLRNIPLKTNSILLDLYSSLGERDHTEKIAAFKEKFCGTAAVGRK